jgi:hypothetical protein
MDGPVRAGGGRLPGLTHRSVRGAHTGQLVAINERPTERPRRLSQLHTRTRLEVTRVFVRYAVHSTYTVPPYTSFPQRDKRRQEQSFHIRNTLHFCLLLSGTSRRPTSRGRLLPIVQPFSASQLPSSLHKAPQGHNTRAHHHRTITRRSLRRLSILFMLAAGVLWTLSR